MEIKKIVLTGGPCAGKTTAIQQIEKEFTEKGYKVLIVPEAATILINSGIKPFGENGIDSIEFQKQVITLQLTLENLAQKTATLDNKKVIILCDRGIIDDKAYVETKVWKDLLKEFSSKEFDLMSRYDLVLHLRTAALGKEEFYTLDNNSARTETPQEARDKDQKTLDAWLGHEKLKIIGNDTSFENKIKSVISEIYNVLNRPAPLQIQTKYLVNNIDLAEVEKTKLVKLELEQYVIMDGEKELTYRKTGKDQEEKYTLVTKIDTLINNERITTQRNITEEEYYDNKDEKIVPIKKVRYCFEYKNQYFRLDIFDDGLKVLEQEETDKTKKINLPPFIKVEKEITSDITYRNSALFEVRNQKVAKKVK